MPFYERRQVRIHYRRVGSVALQLVVIPGRGLNSRSRGRDEPFNLATSSRASFALSRRIAQARAASLRSFEVDPAVGSLYDGPIGLDGSHEA